MKKPIKFAHSEDPKLVHSPVDSFWVSRRGLADCIQRKLDKQLQSADVLLMLWMATRMTKANRLRTTQKALANEFGVTRQTIQQRITRLKEARLLVWVYIVREGAGHYLVNPSFIFYGKFSGMPKAQMIFNACWDKQRENMDARKDTLVVELDEEEAAPTLEPINLPEAA